MTFIFDFNEDDLDRSDDNWLLNYFASLEPEVLIQLSERDTKLIERDKQERIEFLAQQERDQKERETWFRKIRRANKGEESDSTEPVEIVKPKRGRRKGSVGSDPKQDRKLAEAWNKGQGVYRSHEQLAKAFHMTTADAKAALDRHRKRQK